MLSHSLLPVGTLEAVQRRHLHAYNAFLLSAHENVGLPGNMSNHTSTTTLGDCACEIGERVRGTARYVGELECGCGGVKCLRERACGRKVAEVRGVQLDRWQVKKDSPSGRAATHALLVNQNDSIVLACVTVKKNIL